MTVLGVSIRPATAITPGWSAIRKLDKDVAKFRIARHSGALQMLDQSLESRFSPFDPEICSKFGSSAACNPDGISESESKQGAIYNETVFACAEKTWEQTERLRLEKPRQTGRFLILDTRMGTSLLSLCFCPHVSLRLPSGIHADIPEHGGTE